MTFVQTWNIVFAWLIVGACIVTAIGSAYEAIKTHGLDRIVPVIAGLILMWIGGIFLSYWGLWEKPVAPELIRPDVFALAMTVLMFLVGYRRAKS